MRVSPCEQCGSLDRLPLFSGVRDYISNEIFAIQRCESCGLCVTDPLLTDEVIARYYPQRYRTDRQKYTGPSRVKLRAAAVPKHFDPNFRGKLLDLGCGNGAFALEMQQRGWDVAVTEINDAALDEMRAKGMEAKRPDEAMRDGFAKKFDAITAWHVLEHVEHPLALAKWARTQLTPDGIFQATVPNLASWQAQVFNEEWLHLDVPRHRYHFTPGTLPALLHEAGFEIIHSTRFTFEYDVFGWLQSALNGVCTRPNVLFELLTATCEGRPAFPKRDIILSYALTPLFATWVVPMTFIAWLAGGGASLTFTCRPAGGFANK